MPTLKFTVNTTYNGENYGPDYNQSAVEVDNEWATLFVAQNRAVGVTVEESNAGDDVAPDGNLDGEIKGADEIDETGRTDEKTGEAESPTAKKRRR